jgi:hypothetical protein
MLRGIALAFLSMLLGLATPARAQDPTPEFPEPIECFAPLDDTGIGDAEKSAWSACEKWVWSCIRQGQEANLFDKTACQRPRSVENALLRKKLRLAPFKDPEIYEKSNALSDDFLLTILTNPLYSNQIPPVGVRIFGAYFKDPINLENLSTKFNLVLDASIMMRGLRLTNFRSEKNLSLDGSNIHGSLHLMRARIDGSVFLEKGVYDYVDMNDARIGASVEATGSVFNDEFRMHRAHVDGKVILTKARITAFAAWTSTIGSSLELRLADIRYGIDLTGATIEGDVHMQNATFGRQTLDALARCDWNPAHEANHVLNDLKLALPEDDFARVLKETVENRPVYAGKIEPNYCAKRSAADPNAALLRSMKVGGTLCLVNVSGHIETPGSVNYSRSIDTISLDNTTASTTILRWNKSASETRWQAVNFKTKNLLIGLESQPLVHYTDNLDVGVITFLNDKSREEEDKRRADVRSDEYLVSLGCDIIPDDFNTVRPSDRRTQNRIIKFFEEDRSGSAQPFSAIVKSLGSSGVNTVHLRKSLSALQNRNACTSSEFSKAMSDDSLKQFSEIWPKILSKQPAGVSKPIYLAYEFRDVLIDGGCSAWQVIHANAVGYGHEPLRLGFWIAAAIILFRALLMLDSRRHEKNFMRKPLGLAYAIDNLIPLKLYRIDPENADELPNNRGIRWYRSFHRLLGLFFAVMIFAYIYKAST